MKFKESHAVKDLIHQHREQHAPHHNEESLIQALPELASQVYRLADDISFHSRVNTGVVSHFVGPLLARKGFEGWLQTVAEIKTNLFALQHDFEAYFGELKQVEEDALWAAEQNFNIND